MFSWLRENRELKQLHAMPISPAVQRIIGLCEDPSQWTREFKKYGITTSGELIIVGPCDIKITVNSYNHEWYHVYVNGDELTLTKRDELEIAKLVDDYRNYAAGVKRIADAEAERERQSRIWNHLEECSCA